MLISYNRTLIKLRIISVKMASTDSNSQIELYYFLALIAIVLILRVRRTLNGQRYSNRIFTLPIIYALILSLTSQILGNRIL